MRENEMGLQDKKASTSERGDAPSGDVGAASAGKAPSPRGQPAASSGKLPRKQPWPWWAKLVVQPLLLVSAGLLVIVALGAAQRIGWISTGGDGHRQAQVAHGGTVRYVCPMMCTPPRTEPGRCPVCGMELVPVTSDGNDSDQHSIQIDPVARRVANIRTVAVKAAPLVRNIRAVGKLSYDEGTLKTIAAYVDGRLERLYADYTGVVVGKGDHLAMLYSPELYSGQMELLVAKESRERTLASGKQSLAYNQHDLYDSAREQLTEYGMTPEQLAELEKTRHANSRIPICAPISGTVIEKLAVEGQYVKTGQPIYRLADLSTVWLMLEMFPEDAAAIRYGQKVEAEVQSLPGRTFTGRVAFIDPTVEPKTRTVGVRVVIPNGDGLLRVGDYAKASISVRLSGSGRQLAKVYDPELADKWISPRHPHVIESSPGKCRVCGVELVPAAKLGFTSDPAQDGRALLVPRDAVLMVGEHGVLYVETEPGRFEVRRVVLGPSSGDEIAILEGVEEGEQVACSGNFLIDSQMQLAGNPSLIDPTKYLANLAARPTGEDSGQASPLSDPPPMGVPEAAQPQSGPMPSEPPQASGGETVAIAKALAKLSPSDRALAEKQRICPVTNMPLGSMDTPIKVDVNGRPVFICCEGCREELLAEPAKHLATLTQEVPQ